MGPDQRWFESAADWDGALPAAFALEGAAAVSPRALLKTLAVRVLGCEAAAVVVEHARDHAPRVAGPLGSRLSLSVARREGFSAIGLAASPIGVDVEVLDPAGEIPWTVLHPIEADDLAESSRAEQPARFARLWSLKEAYVKALGLGFSREPASFRIRLVGETSAQVDDPAASLSCAAATTVWRSAGPRMAAFACVVLEPGASEAGAA